MNAQQRKLATEILAEFGEVLPYSTHDFGRAKDENCLSVILDKNQIVQASTGILNEKRIRQALSQVRAALPPQTLAFTQDRELVVGRGDSQFDILRIARSDAIKYGMTTEDLIVKLQSYDEKFGIDIWNAETNVIQFDLQNLPADINAFVKDLDELCPDIVKECVQSAEDLADNIEYTRNVFLWWRRNGV